MTNAADNPHELAEYRDYLMTIAHLHLEPKLQVKLDASDIVQQTLLEAHEQREQFRGQSRPEFAAWLKQILVHNLLDLINLVKEVIRKIKLEKGLE